jgi:monoamine oxidase
MEEENLDTRSPEQWQAALAECLPGVRVTNAFGHNWTTDPLTRGTWCSYKAGQLVRVVDELARTEGRLFFASADHGEGWRGFIDGAIGSGARAASEVARALGDATG